MNYTPLCIAAEKNYLEMAQLLLRYHANVHALNSLGNSPLSIALKNNAHDNLIETLIEHDSNINNNNGAPLLYALAKNNITATKLLLQQPDIRLNFKGSAGETPREWAIRTKNSDLIYLLSDENMAQLQKTRTIKNITKSITQQVCDSSSIQKRDTIAQVYQKMIIGKKNLRLEPYISARAPQLKEFINHIN